MTGSLFPRETPRPTKSSAELDLYRALKSGLPDGWTAWHSLKLRVGRQWEGEGDFVLAIPDRGLLVLEVKGGRIELTDGHWMQNGKVLPKAPRDQAQTFVRNLIGEIRRARVEAPPFGVACAFPDCEFSDAPASGDLRGLVIGRRDLPWLSAVLKSLIAVALPAHAVPAPDPWIKVLHQMWGETWVPHVRLRDRVRDAEQRAVSLNERQLEILDIAGDNPRALVEGAAGTGKTILARELCLRRARTGRSAFYACFTDALANVVGASFADTGVTGLTAVSLRQHALELVGGSPPTDRAGWHDVLGSAALAVALRDQPSLVVIDEAQDFEEADWAFIEAMSRGSDLWVFCDQAQSFWPERSVPVRLLTGAAHLRLFSQQRNPPEVAALAALYAGSSTSPVPGPAMKIVAAQPGCGLDVITSEVARLIEEGASPQEIAVLSLAGQSRSEVINADHFGNWPAARADSAQAGESIVCDTFLRFKGLERPFVILTEVERATGDRYDARMHIGLTRATAQCIVVAESEGIAADPRLAGYASASLGQ